MVDDNFDDNRDDNYAANDSIQNLKYPLSRLVRALAGAWQCGGQGFESP
ncbi:hypothetical protein MGAST_16840 [Mycobacterium gastri 'Wayne']|nr:hypothetical protein MGAST_16840 [Mycobacterium gastri 'Wayne']